MATGVSFCEGGLPMELRHLRYFVAVADERNFTRAAQRLGITQPSLSSQIRQLETKLGTPLLRRETRGVELTDAGKLMFEEARIILAEVERVKMGVGRRARGETGKINIGSAGAAYFHPLIPTIIREFKKKYPDVAWRRKRATRRCCWLACAQVPSTLPSSDRRSPIRMG
jgi:DNA-binding transcriptional LysR family regulator